VKILSFRITNFRSIVDSGWVQFSQDGITVLVGQNESGKTSVLEALHSALNRENITADDMRIEAIDPKVTIKVEVSWQEVLPHLLSEIEPSQACLNAAEKFIHESQKTIDLECSWVRKQSKSEAVVYEFEIDLINSDRFEQLHATEITEEKNAIHLSSVAPIEKPQEASSEDAAEEAAEGAEPVVIRRLTSKELAFAAYMPLPATVLFNAESGLLPGTVDLGVNGEPTGSGAIAAANFLTIAEIDLPRLVQGDERYRQNILNKANDRVSEDFASFWSQVIGSGARLKIECDIKHYGSEAGSKMGKKHLVFWIKDGNTQLYPKQRSLGVRWFVSFYLQLRASEKIRSNRMFLLDEPGANLHAKAQVDVLKLINRLKNEIPIVYSTHSPQMIEYDKLFRIRAVQRASEQEDSPTILIDGHHLATASSDTLSPILGAMGADMSQQAAIKKYRNVLLEEVSGYYYLRSFWKLFDIKTQAHFIPATGVNKVPMLANMFLGWGLDFIVAVDDDKQGRDVFNQLKKEMFGDLDDMARKQLLKIPDCDGIEEVFSTTFFYEQVLKANPPKSVISNAEYMKVNHISKPLKALEFWLAVDTNQITKNDLDQKTTEKIMKITNAISSLLDLRPSA
jgi:predicted ATP-binding protein involved in virulence